jgi:hypothetical protein
MSYPRQSSVNARLHKETLAALEKTGSKGLYELAMIWRHHRKELQLAIMNGYRYAAPEGNWSLGTFKMMAKPYLDTEIRGVLERFRALSAHTIKTHLNSLYNQSWARYAWILDQLTPESRDIRVPHKKTLHEAAVTGIYYGAQASQAWAEKWSAWVESYGSALINNLALGASNSGPISDAVAEVDATKSNTPQASLIDALVRLYDYAATEAMMEGSHTIADMNDDSAEEEIWKTRGDLNVCDDCQENEGETRDSADGDIPLHPNCHCYWLLVPKSYAELLRSGDSDDVALANQMRDEGIVPEALVIRNADGDIAAKTIVDFNQWQKGQGYSVTAQ